MRSNTFYLSLFRCAEFIQRYFFSKPFR